MTKHIKPGSTAHRALAVDRSAINEEARTVELAFSSEAPYERYWGVEILDHSATSIRLGRLSGGGPLLMDHDSRDHVGVIESVQIGADRVGRAVVRFGKSARAEEVFHDVVDGIRRNISVGYVIHKAVLVETGGDGSADTYRVSDWEPFEVSLVSVPADASVGVGRSAEAGDRIEFEAIPTPVSIQEKIVEQPNIEALRADAQKAEQKRTAEIIAMGEQFKHLGADTVAAAALRDGKSVEEARTAVLAHIGSKPAPSAEIGMSEAETRQYSVLRVLHALANPTDARAREAAAFEFEASRAAADKQGREVKGIMVPFDVLKRELVVGTPTAGGNLVATNLLSGDFIAMLRNAMVIDGMGARFLTGLSGNLALPRMTGGATAYWVAEGVAPTASQQAFDQVPLSPKTLGARTQLSRKLLLQSSIDAEGLVRSDLATALGLELQRAAINGSGSGAEPRGILNISGIGSVAGGTNGLIPTWGNVVDLESQVAIANADVGTLGYLTNAKVRGKLKQVSKVTGQNGFIWDDGAAPLNGYRAAVTNAAPSNLTKGTASAICSAILFGNWADLVIGMWGGLELQVDPYSSGDTGSVIVRAFQDSDIAVRHPESFSAMKDALTA